MCAGVLHACIIQRTEEVSDLLRLVLIQKFGSHHVCALRPSLGPPQGQQVLGR